MFHLGQIDKIITCMEGHTDESDNIEDDIDTIRVYMDRIKKLYHVQS